MARGEEYFSSIAKLYSSLDFLLRLFSPAEVNQAFLILPILDEVSWFFRLFYVFLEYCDRALGRRGQRTAGSAGEQDTILQTSTLITVYTLLPTYISHQKFCRDVHFYPSLYYQKIFFAFPFYRTEFSRATLSRLSRHLLAKLHPPGFTLFSFFLLYMYIHMQPARWVSCIDDHVERRLKYFSTEIFWLQPARCLMLDVGCLMLDAVGCWGFD